MSFFIGWSNKIRTSTLRLLSFISTFRWKYCMCPVLSSLSTNDRTKGLFTLWTLGSINKLKYRFWVYVYTVDQYDSNGLLVKSWFELSQQFSIILSWQGPYQGKKYFVCHLECSCTSWIGNNKIFQVIMIFISQLIRGTSRVLLNLLQCFNITAISSFFLLGIFLHSFLPNLLHNLIGCSLFYWCSQ